MLTDLGWLPRPGERERDQFNELLIAPGGGDIDTWRRLLAIGWSESELRRAGQRVRGSIAAGGAASITGVVTLRMLVIASHTFAHMTDAVIASALRHGVALEIEKVEYVSPEGWLADTSNRADRFDVVLIAADAAAWRMPHTIDADEGAALNELARTIDRVLNGLSERGARSIILQTVTDDLSDLGINLDSAIPGSRLRMLRGLNDCLSMAAGRRGDLVLDVARLASMVGLETWWPGRFWFSAKLPFAQRCIPLYGDNLGRILAAKVGKSRRVFVLDLDNTLWSGVIGDDGVEGIVLGQGSAAGEAHLTIQRIAKAYASRGVILCLASKNTHEIAMEAFQRHPDMVLREEDIAASQINWNDKASNIRALARTLNLGLESFVFLDDNPVERKQVRSELPEVAIPELPADPADWPVVLQGAGYFEQISFTAEDRLRGQFYKSIADRNQVAAETGDTDAFLKSLSTELTISPFDAMGRKRVAQLISKSNQFNLTTRRYSEQEVTALECDPNAVTMQMRLSDIFGDAGMISVIIGRKDEDALVIEAWLMSCRVLGRRVQEAALKALVDRARELGVSALRGDYLPTSRNGIVAEHYSGLGFRRISDLPDGGGRWELLLDDYSQPDLPMKIHFVG